ncbi:AAA family ATPase [Streptomyces sp. RPA4-5]|uniref:helix-turn-helix transcriptional regulator n=1 Tax=unclassified Streptomyces TaxID=2593676 RepID=UPI00143EC784|nr:MULTISPECIES: LuxR family transcriptional regulator [unclassified Streptomyces]QIY58848.1 AAA family ATPase [Streptomyces sp. RPA4-5]WJY42129.1 AAA family ATPase [Streptomyces sp. P9-2B-2]
MTFAHSRDACGDDWPLVGRERELAAMDAVAAEVLSGRPRVVQLEGSAGIGKSALLSTWWERNGQFRVLRARCHPLERAFAFGAVRQLFKPLLAAVSDTDRARLLAGSAAATLRALDDAAATDPLPENANVTATTLRELNALVSRLARRQPLLLAVDALQWIDQPSLRWLVHFIGRADSHPVLIAVTTRSAEGRRLDPLFAELVRPANCHTLVVEPLDVDGVGQLVRTLWGAEEPEAAFWAACHAATGGHPLFVRALLHQAQRSGVKPTTEFRDRIPTVTLSTLGGEISHRLCQASDEVVALARALAFLGDRKPPELLAAYCGTGRAVVQSAAEELRSLGLLRADGDPRFTHPVVRDTVLATLSPEELGVGHARAAQVSCLSGRPDEEVAAHLLAAGPVHGSWVLPALRRAATEALRRGAPETAVTYLRSALHQPLDEPERARVLLELGTAASHYDAALAISCVTGALEGLTDEAARSDALGVLAYSLLLSRGSRTDLSSVDRKIAALSERPTAGPGAADRELALRMSALRSWMEFERPSVTGPAPAPSPDRDDEPADRTAGERQLLAIRAFHALRAALPAPYVTALVERASVNLPAFSHDLFPLHYFVAQTLLYLDELDTADRLNRHLTREISGRGMELLVSSLTVYRAVLALRRGNIAETLAAAQDAADHASPTGRLPYALTLDTIRIDALLAQGRVEAAERVAVTHAVAGQTEVAWERPRFLMSLAALRIAQGEPRSGLSLLRECGHHSEALGTVSPAMSPWRSRAVPVHLALGEAESAHALAEQELDLARRCRLPRALGVALRAAGLAAAGSRGLDLLAEAVTVLRPTPARLELARACHDFGVALLRRDDKRGARRTLREGLDLAVGCGATVLATRLEEGLHLAGGRVARSGSQGLRGLTAGEERVGTLAAQGYSNKQIAELLVVSLRTVETHLTGAYRKLGITGRPHLAAALAEAGRSRGGSDPADC